MSVLRSSRGIPGIIVVGVAVPAMLLAGLAIILTLRIAGAVEAESARYNSYFGQQLVEAYEQELMAHLRGSMGPAENASRAGAPPQEIIDALQAGTSEFEGAHFVTLDLLNDYSLLMVESEPLLYAPGEGRRRAQFFVGRLLYDGEGQVVGAGGWWMNPRKFLVEHLDDVMQDRLPSSPRLYGGLESTRKLSFELRAPDGTVIGRVRNPRNEVTARTEPFAGPFEGYTVRVAPTPGSTVVWTRRFLALEITFIGLMGLAIVAASIFGLRYTMRQLELVHLKSSFVSNVTHELKTPIALIRLAVETLQMRRVSTPEENEKFLRTIGRETARLSQLVDNILDFARLEAGQRIFGAERVDLGHVVRDAVESLGPRLEHQGFKVEVDVPEGLPPVRGDTTALTHCVLNLLDNAIKYSRTRREVRVSAAARDGAVTASVADRGIGIAPADQKRIFEKFVRVETGLVHDVKGAGLGLSLVDQIMRAHGGHVEVVSNTGEGSTFTLVLPQAHGATWDKAEPRLMTGS